MKGLQVLAGVVDACWPGERKAVEVKEPVGKNKNNINLEYRREYIIERYRAKRKF